MNIFFWRRKGSSKDVSTAAEVENKPASLLTKDELIEFAEDLSGPYSPIPIFEKQGFHVMGADPGMWSSYSSPNEQLEAGWNWVKRADSSCLGTMIQILCESQAWERVTDEYAEGWENEMSSLIGHWGMSRFHEWLPKIQELLNSDDVNRRILGFEFIVRANQPLCLPLLKEMMPRIHSMNESEAITYIEAIFNSTSGRDGSEGQEILLNLQDSMTSSPQKVKDVVEKRLSQVMTWNK